MLNTTSVSCFGEYILKKSRIAQGTTYVGVGWLIFSTSGLPSSVYYEEIKRKNKQACANVSEFTTNYLWFCLSWHYSQPYKAYNDRSKSLIRKYLYVKNTKVTILFVAMLISIDYMVRWTQVLKCIWIKERWIKHRKWISFDRNFLFSVFWK